MIRFYSSERNLASDVAMPSLTYVRISWYPAKRNVETTGNRSPSEANLTILITVRRTFRAPAYVDDIAWPRQGTPYTSLRLASPPHVVKQQLSSSPGAPVTRRDPVVCSGRESGDDGGGRGRDEHFARTRGHCRGVPPPPCSFTSLPFPSFIRFITNDRIN